MNWGSLLRTALIMGIAPDAFWRLSWREWHLLTAANTPPALGRDGLDALMAQFPDGET